MRTFDSQTIQSSGAFMVGELERLDQTLHMPLVQVSWGRDIDLRSDVSLGDEYSSFTNSFFASAGIAGKGKNWVGADSTAINGIALGMAKTTQPMRLWGMELGYTVKELAAAQQTGRGIDQQKHAGLKLKHQMDIDEMVYVGDAELSVTGLVNNSAIAPVNVNTSWETATPKQILADINDILHTAWKQSGYALLPTHVLLPPSAMARLTQPVSEAGTKSILQYVREECLCNSVNGRLLEINPAKWLNGRGVGKKNRMMAYTKGEQFVRYPLVPMQSTPVEYRGLYILTTYYACLGEVEFVYPETVAYCDGI